MSRKEYKAQKLYDLMSEISEERWCAGWLVDIEHILWDALETGSGAYDTDQLMELRDLRDACNGWWHWDRNTGKELVSLDVFKTMHEEWKNKQDQEYNSFELENE